MAALSGLDKPYRSHLGAAGLLALGLYLYVVNTGLAGTGDTYQYLYAARTLQEQGALLTPEGHPFWQWPPLFPFLLRFSGPATVCWLNGLSVLVTYVGWSVVGRWLLPAGRGWALPWLLALSTPMLMVSKFIWSEALYSALWAGYALALLAWLRQGGWRWGLVATGLGCLLPLQRLAGLFLLAGVGVGLLNPGRQWRWRPSWLALAVHLAGTATGLALWQLHRWPQSLLGSQAEGTLAVRPVAELTAIVADYSCVLCRWLVPVLPAATLLLLPALAWGLALGGLLVALWPRPTASRSVAPGNPLDEARLLYLVLLVTLGLLVLSAVWGRSGLGINDAERYLLPLYPVVVLLMLRAWPAGRWAVRLGPWLLGAWLLGQAGRVGHVAHHLRQLPPATTRIDNRAVNEGIRRAKSAHVL